MGGRSIHASPACRGIATVSSSRSRVGAVLIVSSRAAEFMDYGLTLPGGRLSLEQPVPQTTVSPSSAVPQTTVSPSSIVPHTTVSPLSVVPQTTVSPSLVPLTPARLQVWVQSPPPQTVPQTT